MRRRRPLEGAGMALTCTADGCGIGIAAAEVVVSDCFPTFFLPTKLTAPGCFVEHGWHHRCLLSEGKPYEGCLFLHSSHRLDTTFSAPSCFCEHPWHQRALRSSGMPKFGRFFWQSSQRLLTTSIAPSCALAQVPHQRRSRSAGSPKFARLTCGAEQMPPGQRCPCAYLAARSPPLERYCWRCRWLNVLVAQ